MSKVLYISWKTNVLDCDYLLIEVAEGWEIGDFMIR